MQSPLLPWEVIERVIGHSGDHPETLHSFSLTCRQLRPRALCFMVADAKFKTRDQIFDFCDFLQAKPHLKPLVRSIAVDPVHFAPFPLLHILPNLSAISFISQLHNEGDHSSEDGGLVDGGDSVDHSDSVADDDSSEDGILPEDGASPLALDLYEFDDEHGNGSQFFRPIVLNRSTVTCCKLSGTRIQALHLSHLSFSTYLDFARLLLTFTSIFRLTCDETIIRAEGNRAHLDAIKQRLSERLHLLTVSFCLLSVRES